MQVRQEGASHALARVSGEGNVADALARVGAVERDTAAHEGARDDHLVRVGIRVRVRVGVRVRVRVGVRVRVRVRARVRVSACAAALALRTTT